MLSRAFRKDAIGKNWLKWVDQSTPPKQPIQEMVDLAKAKGEGWVEYMYPKPGGDYDTPSRKVSYIVRVPGYEMFAGAGIYD